MKGCAVYSVQVESAVAAVEGSCDDMHKCTNAIDDLAHKVSFVQPASEGTAGQQSPVLILLIEVHFTVSCVSCA